MVVRDSPAQSSAPAVQPAPQRVPWWLAAAVGIASVLAGLGAAELVSSFVAQNGSPILVVGAAVIDLVPAWLKEAVISVFGTND
ncbi:MAG TPA: oxidoreductase, partial [Diaminobutyricibacter sp.]